MKYSPVFLLIALTIAVAGCGSNGASSPSKTPTASRSFTDPTFKFSFKYPSTWSVPPKGGHQSSSSPGTYILPVSVPGNPTPANLEVTVDGQVFTIPSFVDGKISPDPSGGPDFYHYYHATVDGLPGMRVERWSGKQMDEVDTFVYTRTKSYDIRMDTGTPPFPGAVTSGYNGVVKSFKVQFS